MSGFLMFSEGLKEKIGKKKVKKSIYYVIYRGASNTHPYSENFFTTLIHLT